MTDQFHIGAAPALEPCVQVGMQDYHRLARLECLAYMAAIIAVHGPPPGFHDPGSDICRFRLSRNAHDFGTYYEVAICFDGSNEAAREYALQVEEGLASWDEAEFESPVLYHYDRITGTRFSDVEACIADAARRILLSPLLTEKQARILENLTSAWPHLVATSVPGTQS